MSRDPVQIEKSPDPGQIVKGVTASSNPPRTVALRNPRTGQADGVIEVASHEEISAKATALRDRQRAWDAMGIAGRAEVMGRWGVALDALRDECIAATAADTGRVRESIAEFDATRSALERWRVQANEVLAPTEPAPGSMGFISIGRQFRPFALVGVISPWNFPFLLSLIDAIPALMAGSAVLIKPSEVTPRFAAPLLASLQAVPELPLDVVLGDGATGAALLGHDAQTGTSSAALVDIVCFTGSVATGRKVGAMAAAAFIPAFLELGGKDPAIILPGVDLDLAAWAVGWGSTSGAGQACQSIERIYVHEAIHDAFVEKLVGVVSQFALAYPEPESGVIGPIIAERQVPIIAAHLADAQAKGAVVATGSTVIEHHGGGAWCRPTVLVGANHSMQVMVDETFGPLLPIMKVSSAAEAIALANDTIYGLSAAVMAGTTEEGLAIAAQLQAGAVSINDASLTSIVHEGEKMSFKASGMGGSRMGPSSIRRFVRTQALLVKNTPIRDPWWFPAKEGN
jgi:succinate-semialdehyde dehydrogenase / glutarate-semialdehyde dehydrogenase